MPTLSTRQSTCAVQLTPVGRGAVATVLVTGPQAIEFATALSAPNSGRTLEAEPWGTIRFGRWGGSAGEEVVVTALGPKRVEVHCHGGVAAPQAVLDSLAALGCKLADWQTWLRASETCTIESEAVSALAAAQTERTAAILLDQYQGALVRAGAEISERLAENNLTVARTLVNELLGRAALGLHLAKPWTVVLAGAPNVGKSSLINALVGYERTIVHDAPGTTRDVVTAPASLAGWPVELADTAGLRATADPLEAAGVKLAEARLAAADAIVLVFDIRQAWDKNATRLIGRWPGSIVVYNKADLATLPNDGRPAGILTSATDGCGLVELEQAIVGQLVPAPPAPGMPVPFSTRQVEYLQHALEAIARSDVAAALDLLRRLVGSADC